MRETIGVIGCGVVGEAVLRGFRERSTDVLGYDKYKRNPKSPDPTALMYDQLYEMIEKAGIIFICVPTATNSDGSQDLTPLEETFELLSRRQYRGVVCVKSTVVPGTTRKLAERYQITRYAHNPEFLTAARPYEDFMNQPAVVIGGPEADQVARAYEDAAFTPTIPLETSEMSEMAKYMHNLFLATKVTFFNEMYEHCQAFGIDYQAALGGALAIGQIGKGHTRVPGPDGKGVGFGGMCFIKDSTAFVYQAKEVGLFSEILRAVDTKNRRLRPSAYDGQEATGYSDKKGI